MRILFYAHSVVSDWNHGNAHFLRGVMRELVRRGHDVSALEPADGWSRANLLADQGPDAENAFARAFPELRTRTYDAAFPHEQAVAEAELVIVHEWTDPALIARLGRARRHGSFTLLFHDTHHRAASAGEEIAALDLGDYDAVLAFGECLRERYLRAGWGHRVFTWHEAADLFLFAPRPEISREHDLVWVGNWGDGERSEEIGRFLLEPARALALSGTVRGVRYPAEALAALHASGLGYGGWIANADVPAAFAAHRVTMHIPRRPYVAALPGIPTIRMFEALSCGIPLISAPWPDVEGLFRTGTDYLSVPDGAAMTRALRDVLHDPALAASLAAHGRETIVSRHGCNHRVDELLAILSAIDSPAGRVPEPPPAPEPVP